MTRLAAVAALIACAAGPQMHAQACLGARPFTQGDGEVGVGARLGQDSRSWGGHITVGSERRPFLSAAGAWMRFDDFVKLANMMSLTGGRAFPIAQNRMELCPLVGFERQNGPNRDTPAGLFRLTSRTFWAGGAIGAAIPAPLPAGLTVFLSATHASSRTIGTLAASTVAVRESHGVISAGAALGMARRMTLRPSASFPIGLDRGRPTYAVSFALGFGRRSEAE